MTLRELWEEEARNWAARARLPAEAGDPYFWLMNLPLFLELVPPPGRLTVDLGCGEGRVARELAARGHAVTGLDASPTLVSLAVEADPAGRYLVADAAALPLASGSADLAVAFMSLQDFDELGAAMLEVGRVLEPGGRFCFAIVHPVRSAGRFAGEEPGAAFEIDSYLEAGGRFVVTGEWEGGSVAMHSVHRPLEGYTRALEAAGFAIEALREPAPTPEVLALGRGARAARIPLFLHVRARKAGA